MPFLCLKISVTPHNPGGSPSLWPRTSPPPQTFQSVLTFPPSWASLVSLPHPGWALNSPSHLISSLHVDNPCSPVHPSSGASIPDSRPFLTLTVCLSEAPIPTPPHLSSGTSTATWMSTQALTVLGFTLWWHQNLTWRASQDGKLVKGSICICISVFVFLPRSPGDYDTDQRLRATVL